LFFAFWRFRSLEGGVFVDIRPFSVKQRH